MIVDSVQDTMLILHWITPPRLLTLQPQIEPLNGNPMGACPGSLFRATQGRLSVHDEAAERLDNSAGLLLVYSSPFIPTSVPRLDVDRSATAV
jgi:hypothetical protein